MRLLLLGLFCVRVVVSLPSVSRTCYNSQRVPFTGYRIENQISFKTLENQYHLVYCNDNKLIYDVALNDTIPWTDDIQIGNDYFTLARRKSFVLRDLPLYMPQSLIGGIYVNASDSQSAVPLVADNILKNWVELTHRFDIIIHLPILSTPNIDSKKFLLNRGWDKFILQSEDYKFDYDSRNMFRKNWDKALLQLKRVLGKRPKSNNFFLNLIMLSKLTSQKKFFTALQAFDKLLLYDEVISSG